MTKLLDWGKMFGSRAPSTKENSTTTNVKDTAETFLSVEVIIMGSGPTEKEMDKVLCVGQTETDMMVSFEKTSKMASAYLLITMAKSRKAYGQTINLMGGAKLCFQAARATKENSVTTNSME